MKRCLGILLLFIHLLAYTEFQQLLKVPYMIEHFNNHRLADPTLSFVAFLEMHYVGPFIVDDDYQQDQQLPFRNINISLMNTNVFRSEPPRIEITPPTEVSREYHEFDELSNPQHAAFDIFQPPRCA